MEQTNTKNIPIKDITLFRSCLVSAEYPGIEASTKYIFDKLGIEYVIRYVINHVVQD